MNKKAKWAIIIVAICLVIVGLGVGIWALTKKPDEETKNPDEKVVKFEGTLSAESSNSHVKVKGEVLGSKQNPTLDEIDVSDDGNTSLYQNQLTFNITDEDVVEDIVLNIFIENVKTSELTVELYNDSETLVNYTASVLYEGAEYEFGTPITLSSSVEDNYKTQFQITFHLIDKTQEVSGKYNFRLKLSGTDEAPEEIFDSKEQFNISSGEIYVFDGSNFIAKDYVSDNYEIPTSFDIVDLSADKKEESIPTYWINNKDILESDSNHYGNYIVAAQVMMNNYDEAANDDYSSERYYVNEFKLDSQDIIVAIKAGTYFTDKLQIEMVSSFGLGLLQFFKQVYEETGIDLLKEISNLSVDYSTIPVPYSPEEKDYFWEQNKKGILALLGYVFANLIIDLSEEEMAQIAPIVDMYPIVMKQFTITRGDTYQIDDANISLAGMLDTDIISIPSDFSYGITNISAETKEFQVNEGNAEYSVVDGVLFNKDATTIVSYPKLKTDSEYKINENVTSINSNAFLNIPNLENIVLEYNSSRMIGLLSSLNNRGFGVTVETNEYISRFKTAEWESNNLTVPTIIYLDDAGLEYQDSEAGFIVTGSNNDVQVVEIPTTYSFENGIVKDVVGIGEGAFQDNITITNIVLPNTLKSIGDNAFAGATNLNNVDFVNAKITSFGTNVFGGRTDIFVYSQNKGTVDLIQSSYPLATSINMSYEIENEFSGNGGTGPSDIDGTITFKVTVGSHEWTMSSSFYNYLSNNLNSYLVVFDNEEGTANAKVQVILDCYAISGTAGNEISHVQEQIALSRIEEDGSLTKIAGTPTDETYFNHPGDGGSAHVDVSYEGEVNKGDKLSFIVNFTILSSYEYCFTEGTLVTLADGTTKAIEEVTYDDLLLVWDFDRGEFGYTYPVWITKAGENNKYYLMKFDDGSELEVVFSHRLFNADTLTFEKSIDAIYSQVGQSFVRQVIGEDGKPTLTTTKCVSITEVEENCVYYNMITSQALNFFSNGFLGSTGLSNMYTFEKTEDGRYIHNQEQLEKTKANGDVFEYEMFDTSRITYEMYVGYRLGELKNMVDILAQTPPYSQLPIEQVYAYAISVVNDYFPDGYFDAMKEWPSTMLVTTSDGASMRVNKNETYILSAPEKQEGFAGWYNSFDGKIYQAGDEVTIYMNTHFVARYN